MRKQRHRCGPWEDEFLRLLAKCVHVVRLSVEINLYEFIGFTILGLISWDLYCHVLSLYETNA